MNIVDLRNDIVSKNIKHLYILYGEEHTILDIYVKQITDLFETVYTVETFSVVKSRLNSNSLFQKGKELYIVRNDKTATEETDIETLEKKLEKKNIYVILTFHNLDQRTKFFKTFQDRIVEFAKLGADILKKYIKKEIDVTDSCCEYLIGVCKSDYGRILLETNKVKNYATAKHISDYESFKQCYLSGLFYEEPEDEVYGLIDSILSKNIKNIYTDMNDSKKRNDNVIMLLSMLHNSLKAILQVKSFGAEKGVAEATGLTPFQVKNALKYVNQYSLQDIVRFIKYVRYCDKSIKNGTMNQDMVIDYLLINIL